MYVLLSLIAAKSDAILGIGFDDDADDVDDEVCFVVVDAVDDVDDVGGGAVVGRFNVFFICGSTIFSFGTLSSF